MEGTIFRFATSLLGWLILLRMATFLWAYHHKIYKLRKELEGKVLAPPVLWTYLYHVGVGLVILGMASGTIYAVNQGFSFNPFLIPVLLGELILLPSVDRFAKFYIHDLEAAVREQLS